MIKIENIKTYGWEEAIRGMRNPLNSWNKIDSHEEDGKIDLGQNDEQLMRQLCLGGPCHAKFRRMIVCYMDITAPLYWWKEFDTYKVGTVSNSCSTMHTIHKKEITIDDFSHEYLTEEEELSFSSMKTLKMICGILNHLRRRYLSTNDKIYWYQLIQLLPTSYNQKRTIMLNYEVLYNIYHQRRHHKLIEWRDFCTKIFTLPYNWIITEKGNDLED